MQNSPKLKIQYHERSLKFLKKISYAQSKRITVRIKLIQKEEDLIRGGLNIKKLTGTRESYRLRVGKIRAILRLYSREKILYVEKIDFRGNVY